MRLNQQNYGFGENVFDLKNKNIYLIRKQYVSVTSIFNPSQLSFNNLYIKYQFQDINLSVEPVKTQDIINIAPLTADEKAIVSTKPMNPAFYDVKSKYAELFDGKNGYIVSAEESLAEIQKYFKS
jgi:hypothetical protein